MIQYSLVGTDEGSVLTVFVKGGKPTSVQSTHPYYADILYGVIEGDESVLDLVDLSVAAATKFDRLTERVTVANGRLYFDGEEVANALSSQVIRFIQDGVDDWKPLVNFFENVQQNPNEHSREQLYNWLMTDSFTITPDGLIVGYKGVRTEEDQFYSINHGRAIVDGMVYNGAVPNYKGAVVEMPRGEVQFDPGVGCSTGLHVGTYKYASGFAQGAVLEVHVNPRDVVSVPTDCAAQKMRVCRYKVVDTIEVPYTVAVTYAVGYGLDEDYDWGDGEEDEFNDTDDLGYYGPDADYDDFGY